MIYAAAIVGVLMLTTAMNLVVETSAELTAAVLADSDVGIATGQQMVSSSGIVDTTPDKMLILSSGPLR